MTDRPRYCKRLIEVDLPIKDISAHARREKSIRHGHISTLHIWWARRPLAACRAVICASLWPDPADELCPQDFREQAASILQRFADGVGTDRQVLDLVHSHYPRWNRLRNEPWDVTSPKAWLEMRQALLDFIADFANWDASTVPLFLETSRALTHAAHCALGGVGASGPSVLDPFAGGGAIPLEVSRCGGESVASDLNPIAVMQNRLILEVSPKIDASVILRFKEIASAIASRLSADWTHHDTVQTDSSSSSDVFARFYARTVVCEGPTCGIEIPLIRSFCLSIPKKIYLDWARSDDGHLVCESVGGRPTPRPKLKLVRTTPTAMPTTRNGSAVCPLCGFVVAQSRVAKQALESGFVHRLVAVGKLINGSKVYELPREGALDGWPLAHDDGKLAVLEKALQTSINPLRPSSAARGMSAVTRYGYGRWRDLFSDEQVCLFAALLGEIDRSLEGEASDQRENLRLLLLLAVDRMATFQNLFCRWAPKGEHPVPPFGKNGFPMIWDHVVSSPFTDSPGGWMGGVDWLVRVLEHLRASRLGPGVVQQMPAQRQWLPDDSVDLMFTDPPYYDSYPYADLSDFFYPILASGLVNSGLPEAQSITVGELSPKSDELVVQPSRFVAGQPKDNDFYRTGLIQALDAGRRTVRPGGLGVVVFANKSVDGWEAVLEGLLASGWTISASWPIQTERESRTRNQARLQSSVHIVCRPREEGNVQSNGMELGDWRSVLSELPKRIHEWMPRLARDGVVGADAIFACLGPAVEVFSRYSRVEKTNGEPVLLREFLELVWAAVAREALSMIFEGADASGFEEDARLTAMWLWTLNAGAEADNSEAGDEDSESEGVDDGESVRSKLRLAGYVLEFDAARKIAQGLGVHLDSLHHLVEVKGDTARMLPVGERSNYLFGKEAFEKRPEAKKGPTVPKLLQLMGGVRDEELAWTDLGRPEPGKTTLDKVHQAMLLFGAGRGDALKWFLVDGSVGKEAQFWKLAQAFSALYPAGSDEKRWVDGVLARKKGLGF